MSALFFVVGGCILGGTPLILIPLLRHWERTRSEQARFVGKFFERAPKLVADERIPDELIKVIAAIGRTITDRRMVYHLIGVWINGRLNGVAHGKGQIAFARAVESLSPELRKAFAETTAYALLGLSYSAPIAGAVLRRMLFNPVGIPERADEAPNFAYQAMEKCAPRGTSTPQLELA